MTTTTKTALVTFTAFGRDSGDGSSSDILVGANLGCAQVAGLIEREYSWEKVGTSRKNTIVAGSARFTVQAYVDELNALEGVEFDSVKAVRDAVRAALAGVR